MGKYFFKTVATPQSVRNILSQVFFDIEIVFFHKLIIYECINQGDLISKYSFVLMTVMVENHRFIANDRKFLCRQREFFKECSLVLQLRCKVKTDMCI